MPSSTNAAPLPRAWEVFLFTLPAILVGLALRVVLCSSMPLAFFSPDTNEFLEGRLFGGSRTFLPKIIYQLPSALDLPFLPSVAIFQHTLGLIGIFASGWLCVLWLRAWRWWIIPFTMLLAVHPALLWYEHFALPDSIFIVTLITACVAAGFFFRRKDTLSLVLLFVVLSLVAGARQEGFIFLFFGLALVIRVYWGNWSRFRIIVPLVAVLAVIGAKLTKTNQGGYMLVTSLIQWAPDQLRTEPAISPRIAGLRERFREQWPAYPDDHNMSRKIIVGETDAYLVQERQLDPKKVRDASDALCKKIAVEIALRNLWRLPGLAFNKFRAMHLEALSPDFGPAWAHDKHLVVLFGKPDGNLPKEHKLMKFYLGQEYDSRPELQSALPKIYRILPGDWLSRFHDRYATIEYSPTLLPGQQVGRQFLPGLPLLYFLAAAGFAAVFLRAGRTISDQQLWILTLLFQAFVIFLTGSVRSRYRLSFEPWFLLGAFCFLDFLVCWGRSLLARKPAPEEA